VNENTPHPALRAIPDLIREEKVIGGEIVPQPPSPLVGEGAPALAGAGEGAKQRVPAYLRNFSRRLRHNATEAEQTLWRLLRDRRLTDFKFRRQVPIGPYIADFVCYEARLVVELDGSQHAGSKRDAVRDEELNRRGFRVLRIWNNDLANPNVVLDAIWSALNENTPSSGATRHLLPPGEKGIGGEIVPQPPSPLVGEGAPKGRVRGPTKQTGAR
jgi:very-short-patch-repair endonuclease